MPTPSWWNPPATRGAPTPGRKAPFWACSFLVSPGLREERTIDMEGKAKREAGFPGDSFGFEVSPPQGAEGEIEWSGGGDPAAGSGPRFTTAFGSGGVYMVTA